MLTDTTKAIIRLATIDDILPCVMLIRKLRLATFWQHLDADSETGVAGVLLAHRLLTSKSSCLYVADVDGVVVGLCGGELTSHFMSPHITLLIEWAWWVEPDNRESSIGARLWLTVCEWGKQRGAKAALRTRVLSSEKRGKQLGEESYSVKEL